MKTLPEADTNRNLIPSRIGFLAEQKARKPSWLRRAEAELDEAQRLHDEASEGDGDFAPDDPTGAKFAARVVVTYRRSMRLAWRVMLLRSQIRPRPPLPRRAGAPRTRPRSPRLPRVAATSATSGAGSGADGDPPPRGQLGFPFRICGSTAGALVCALAPNHPGKHRDRCGAEWREGSVTRSRGPVSRARGRGAT